MRGKDEPRKADREGREGSVDHARARAHGPARPGTRRPSSTTVPSRAGAASGRRASDWLEPALVATLQALPTAALIVDRLGNVVLANEAGRELAAAFEAAELVDHIEAARAGARTLFAITELMPDGRGPVLAVRRVDEPSLEERLEHAADQFGLTKAHTRVLAFIARGLANRAIALELGISERTVEAHVTAILDRLGVDSRAAAVAGALGNPDGIAPGKDRSGDAPPAPASSPRRTA